MHGYMMEIADSILKGKPIAEIKTINPSMNKIICHKKPQIKLTSDNKRNMNERNLRKAPQSDNS